MTNAPTNHLASSGHRAALKAGLTHALLNTSTNEVLGRYGDRASALEALDASTATGLLLVAEVATLLEAVAA